MYYAFVYVMFRMSFAREYIHQPTLGSVSDEFQSPIISRNVNNLFSVNRRYKCGYCFIFYP